ncbi:MAG: hypothetical protein DWQ04_18350 [Chloroflexi bacterium]|nr:MAG: hypothetical protein DWQ04_18350 [Chloroflexota bacterium]
MGDFDAGEDFGAIESGVVEVNTVVGGHFPADIPAVLLVAAVGECAALHDWLGYIEFGAPTSVKGAGHFVAGHVHKDVVDAPAACGVYKGEIDAPIIAAFVVGQPCRHGDHGWVGVTDLTENGRYPHIPRRNVHRS